MEKINKDALKNINGGIVFISYIDCPLENDISEENPIIAILYIDDKDNVCQGILITEDLLEKHLDLAKIPFSGVYPLSLNELKNKYCYLKIICEQIPS